MTRFLTLASKALAVIGVLTLMWTAGGMQTAKADPNPGGEPTQFWPCYDSGTLCRGDLCFIGHCATDKPPATDDSGARYCC